MKNPWLVYVAAAAISALAGIAIAGPPNTVSTDATIIVPETTATTSAPEPAPTTTDAPPDSTTSTTTTTTDVADTSTTTTTTTTTTTEPVAEIDRAEVEVVAVNGASIGGLASRVRDELRDAGFERARPADGTTIVDTTVVYFAEGFVAEAVDVAEALGLELGDVKPISDAPSFDLGDSVVAVYLGRDRG